MPYCYCTPSRSLFSDGTRRIGTKGYMVDAYLSMAAVRGWQTRRENLRLKAQWAEERRVAAEATAAAAKAEAEAATLVPFVVTGTVPADTIAAEPVAITTK